MSLPIAGFISTSFLTTVGTTAANTLFKKQLLDVQWTADGTAVGATTAARGPLMLLSLLNMIAVCYLRSQRSLIGATYQQQTRSSATQLETGVDSILLPYLHPARLHWKIPTHIIAYTAKIHRKRDSERNN